jgi:hypothetical protein
MSCPICQEKECQLNLELITSLSYFSGITQRTLSAFHKAGIDVTLLDEINDLKTHINKPKPLTLKNAIKNNSSTYKRFFTNGYTDIVNTQDLYKPIYINDNTDINIDDLMGEDISPISKMGINLKLNSINTQRISISRPTEHIFFS